MKRLSFVYLQEDIKAEQIDKLNDLLLTASSLVSDSELMKDVVNACCSSGGCFNTEHSMSTCTWYFTKTDIFKNQRWSLDVVFH